MYNKLSDQYNVLKKGANAKDGENARLKKKVQDLEALISARDKELKDAQYSVDYYEDRSTSMKLFTTMKVRAEMMKEFSEGRATNWDPVAASSAWEEMKFLYSDSEGEDEQATEDVGPSQPSSRGTQGEATELGDATEVVVEDVVE